MDHNSQLAAMLKDVLFLLSMCLLSQGRNLNIAIVSHCGINTTELLMTFRKFDVDVITLSMSQPSPYHLYRTVKRNIGKYDRFIIHEEICNSMAVIFRNQGKAHPVTCFRSRDSNSSSKLYVPVILYGTSIFQLMKHLKWSNVFIIADDKDDSGSISLDLSALGISCSTVNFNSTSTSSDIYDTLHMVSLNFFPWHFLLLASNSEALRVLQEASSFDVRNRRRSDMRSSSKWLVLVQDGDLELLHTDMWMDNIAVLAYPAISKNMLLLQKFTDYLHGNIFTLMYRQSGRELEQIGSFDHDEHIEVKSDIFPNRNYGFNGRLLTVSTLRWLPYTYTRNESGKIVFEGIAMDILNELSFVMNFTYKLVQPPDLEWGIKDDHGNWSGLVGQIQRNEIDLIAAALAAFYERLDAMDFTYPFGFDTGLGIYKVPDYNADRWLTLIRPFTLLVHLIMAASFVGCALSLYALRSWHTRSGEEDDVSDTWLVMFGLFIRYSPEVKTRAMSTTFFLGFIGLFGTITASIYCGNMIAFFTVSKQTLPFTTISEVIKQSTYKWGTMGGSLWGTYLQLSKDPNMRAYWNGVVNFNKTDPEVFDTSEVVQKAKVKRGNYVFVVESDILRTWSQEDCSLKLLSDPLYPIQYAIGLPQHSPHTKIISDWIMLFYDRGMLDLWRRKWLTDENNCVAQRSVKGSSVTIMDLQSAFYVLAMGMVAAFMTVVLEWRCRRRQSKKHLVDQPTNRPTDLDLPEH